MLEVFLLGLQVAVNARDGRPELRPRARVTLWMDALNADHYVGWYSTTSSTHCPQLLVLIGNSLTTSSSSFTRSLIFYISGSLLWLLSSPVSHYIRSSICKTLVPTWNSLSLKRDSYFLEREISYKIRYNYLHTLDETVSQFLVQ